MKSCKHNQWLSLCTQGYETALLESDRLQKIRINAIDPDKAKPGLLVFIGDQLKTHVLEKAFGIGARRFFNGRRYVGDIDLHAPRTFDLNHLLLIADATVGSSAIRREFKNHKCHETKRWTIERIRKSSNSAFLEEMLEGVYGRLLLPFTDVYCLFATDLGGLRATSRLVAGWLKEKAVNAVPAGMKPAILIVADQIQPTSQAEEATRREFLCLLKDESAHDVFDLMAAVEVVAIPARKSKTGTEIKRFSEHLLRLCGSIQQNRNKTRTAYSMTHFTAFWESACNHFSNASSQPFSFLKASRVHNPIQDDHAKYIKDFLVHCETVQDMQRFAAPILASSFLLDNYPPDCHLFDPGQVFKQLYHDVLQHALGDRVVSFRQSPEVLLRSGVLKAVQSHLQEYFDYLVTGSEPSAEIHLRNVQTHQKKWDRIYSDTTCLLCIRRAPQYRVDCGHAFCENCVQVAIKPCAKDPRTFRISSCFLCSRKWSKEIVVRIKPPTSGYSLLCMHGGGTRGILPLAILNRLEARIGLPLPVQRHFNIIAGISSGSFGALMLYRRGWSPEKCIEMFFKCANFSFNRDDSPRFSMPSWLSWMVQALRLYRRDGFYSAHNIESVLKTVLGENQTMLDTSYATEVGAKLCVPVATTRKQPVCRLFTNYYGNGQRDERQEAQIMKPGEGGNAPVWEIARAASAAPCYFPTKDIARAGAFQDAGLLRNDPTAIAFSEAKVLYPSVDQADLILSLGTGSLKPKRDPIIRPQNALSRVYNMIWEKSKDEQVQEVFSHIPRYHHLNYEFEQEYSLDNTSHMLDLKSKVESDRSLSWRIDQIARQVIASMFYFELAKSPTRSNGRFVCTGNILCTVRGHEEAFESLMSRLDSEMAQLYLNDEPVQGFWKDPATLDDKGNFRRPVHFESDRHVSIHLRMGGPSSEPYYISGSPTTITQLVRAQGLNAYFGTANHQKRKRDASECIESGRRKFPRRA